MLADIYFVMAHPLKIDNLMSLRAAKRAMLREMSGKFIICAIWQTDKKARRFAEWLGFKECGVQDELVHYKWTEHTNSG